MRPSWEAQRDQGNRRACYVGRIHAKRALPVFFFPKGLPRKGGERLHDATVQALNHLAAELAKAGFLVQSETIIVAGDWRRRTVAATDRCISDIQRGVPIGKIVARCSRVAAMYHNLDFIRRIDVHA